METLIITGCVNVSSEMISVKVKNHNDRLKQYLKTLFWAFTESNFDKIIFCENSLCGYDFKTYIEKINKKQKAYEVFSFKGSNVANKYGKGYGESEIINYVIENSNLLKEENYFWKITGRLSISNINDVIKTTKNNNYFLQWIYSKNSIDTRFYKISKKVYKDNLLDAYKYVNDNAGVALENVFYKVFKSRDIKYRCFKRFPIFVGIAGSSGIKYQMSSLKIKIYNFFCFIGLYNTKLFLILIQFLLRINKT